MQAIWFRAAQARSCRCGSCLHAATITARRTATAASRRRLRIGDLFTACYSTILATAAIADSKIKDDRIKEWDRVIEEAKVWTPDHNEVVGRRNRLEKFESDRFGAPFLMSSTDRVADGNNSLADRLNSSFWSVPPAKSTSSLPSQLRNLGAQLKLVSPSQTPRNAPYTMDTDPELEVLLNEGLQRGLRRDPRKPSHLEAIELMVTELVLRLLKHISSHKERQKLSLPARDMLDRISVLQMSRTQLPKYSINVRCNRHESWDLNKAIWDCFKNGGSKRSKSPNIDFLLSKICYNLLISTTPPDIVTYNILIICLTKAKKHDIAQTVIDSFFHNSKFKPTPRTMCAILDHYAAKNDNLGFRATIRRMRGVNGNMRIKRQVVYDLWRKPVQLWAATNKVIHRGMYLIEKASRTTEVFDSLIRGSLRLMGLRSAIRYIRAALRAGCEIDPSTFRDVVIACLSATDNRAGIALLSAITSSKDGSNRLEVIISHSAEVQYYLRILLNFFGITSLTGIERVARDIPEGGVLSLLRHLQIASLANVINPITSAISKLEAINASFEFYCPRHSNIGGFSQSSNPQSGRSLSTMPHSPEDLLTDIVNSALQILEEASLVREQAENSERTAMQVAIASRTRLEEKRLLEKKLLLISLSYNLLPADLQFQYDSIIQTHKRRKAHHRLTLLSQLHQGNAPLLLNKSESYMVEQEMAPYPQAPAAVATNIHAEVVPETEEQAQGFDTAKNDTGFQQDWMREGHKFFDSRQPNIAA